MKNYIVEFYIDCLQIWDKYDDCYFMHADSADEAIDLAIDWCVEHDARYGNGTDVDEIKATYEDMPWRAAEVVTDNDGYLMPPQWEVR